MVPGELNDVPLEVDVTPCSCAKEAHRKIKVRSIPTNCLLFSMCEWSYWLWQSVRDTGSSSWPCQVTELVDALNIQKPPKWWLDALAAMRD